MQKRALNTLQDIAVDQKRRFLADEKRTTRITIVLFFSKK
jgi:hypothetical protein